MDEHNALDLVRLQHFNVDALLRSLMDSDQPAFTEQVVASLVKELKLHSDLEWTYFYPFARKYLSDDVMSKAVSEHEKVDQLVEQLERISVRHPDFLPTIDSLNTSFKLHAYNEEDYVIADLERRDPDTQNALMELADRMRSHAAGYRKATSSLQESTAG